MKLKVEGITVRLGSRDVLKDLSFEVREGELLALLGPNGSGKSTMLRTIFGLLKPLKGVVMLDGREVESIEESARNLGYLPQETPETNLRVMDIVLLGRTPYMGALKRPTARDLEISIKALKEVGLEGFEDRPFSELSGGERQKVMLARVFAQQPRIMLLDEPTAHLDISAQIEIMEIVKRRVERGCAAIIAIHDINLASSFSTRILMVKDGKIAYAGEPGEVITEESIRDVFGAEVSVKRYGKAVYVVPRLKARGVGRRVHVICGGGSGGDIIHSLVETGYRVSAGVLNILDSDWELVSEIGDVVDEAPFSQISETAHRENIRMIEESDAVVLANLTIGWGNFKNLLAAKHAADLGKLIVVHDTPFEGRNFAGEEAMKIYAELLDKAKAVVKRGEVVDAVQRLLVRG